MLPDLSHYSSPLGSFLTPPATAADWRKYRLSDDQVVLYHEYGYLGGVRILTDQQVEKLRSELQGLLDPSHPGNDLFHEYHTNESPDPARVLFHALGAWRIMPSFHDLLWHPAFTVAASQLLGGPVRFWHDQLFCKPANHGGVVAWHQDYSYWTRTKPMQHITCWIGLDDSTVANGCVHYVPGSHRWELLPITGFAADMDEIKTVLSPNQRAAFKPIAMELKKGEASFHHPLMVHGSYANSTDQPRRATVINAFRDGTRSDLNQPLLKGAEAIPADQPMGGRFFPLLFDPAVMGA